MSAKKKDTFEDWFDTQLAADPDFTRQVEEALQEMKLEQDLVELREARGMSQQQLARTLGVSQPAVAKLESGKWKNLELRTLIRTVHALGGKVRIQIMK
jgi:predicted XRE-type DNA-binding protein